MNGAKSKRERERHFNWSTAESLKNARSIFSHFFLAHPWTFVFVFRVSFLLDVDLKMLLPFLRRGKAAAATTKEKSILKRKIESNIKRANIFPIQLMILHGFLNMFNHIDLNLNKKKKLFKHSNPWRLKVLKFTMWSKDEYVFYESISKKKNIDWQRFRQANNIYKFLCKEARKVNKISFVVPQNMCIWVTHSFISIIYCLISINTSIIHLLEHTHYRRRACFFVSYAISYNAINLIKLRLKLKRCLCLNVYAREVWKETTTV